LETDALSDSKERRSPLRSRPFRVPSRSSQQDIDQTVWEDLLPYVFFVVVMIAIAVTEWLAGLYHLPRQPWWYAGLAVAAIAVAAYKFRQLRAQVERAKRGRDREREVGELLDKLRSSAAAEVFHDIPGDEFKIDHVVLCRKGFFAIETKTYDPPAERDPTVELTGDGVLVDGRRPHHDPLRQARASADWMERLLEESIGRTFAVRGVVLFPGWYVSSMDTVWRCDLKRPWVLGPKALSAQIAREPLRYSASDVKLAAHHLGRYVRIVVPSDAGTQLARRPSS
jgi:hypothetical protein